MMALVLVLALQAPDTLWASWTWRNGNMLTVTSVGPAGPLVCDGTSTRSVRFDLRAGLRTTTLTLDACAVYGWQPVAFALASISDSGQVGPFWGRPEGYRLQVMCRPAATTVSRRGCTLTLKRPLLWGTTVTFTLGPLPMTEVPALRAAMVRAAGGGPANAPTFPYRWVQP